MLNYDYVVKLETQDRDADYIVNNKLQGRGLGFNVNSRRGSSNVLLAEGRYLHNYISNLSVLQYDQLLDKYKADFDMYGYTMDKSVARCRGTGLDGAVCC